MFRYLKFSNIKLAVDLNPFCWRFAWMYQGPTQSDPNLRIQYCCILFLSIIVVIDNGEYHVWEEQLVPTETKDDL